MLEFSKKYFSNIGGATAIEYCLISAGLAVAWAIAYGFFSGALNSVFVGLQGSVNTLLGG